MHARRVRPAAPGDADAVSGAHLGDAGRHLI